MRPPAVSVILNLHNGVEWVRDAVQSVRAQTLGDWELICWDDGSGDGGAACVEAYQDPRIRVVAGGPSGSLARSRQAAMDLARGDWLAFIDQDDVWVPRKLEKQMALATPDVALIYGRALRFGRGRRTRDFDHRHEFCPLPEGDVFLSLFAESCYIAMSSAMLRRSAVVALGAIPEQIGVIPDYWLFLGVARHHRARAVQEIVAYYRELPVSLTTTSYRDMHLEAAWLVSRWAEDLPAPMVSRRLGIHNTLVSLAEMSRLRSVPAGAWRLLRQGSLPFLLSRPFARSARAIKRRVLRPYWVLSGRTAAATEVQHRVDVLGTKVTVSTFDGALRSLASMVANRTPAYVSPVNVYSSMLAHDDPDYRLLLNQAGMVTADGVPIVWVLRALGHPAGRVHNDDLFLECCLRYPEWRHYLVGGREGQPERVGEELRRRFPGLKVAGSHATPLRPVPSEHTDGILEAIRASGADIVWVGMGTPAQDQWMASAISRAGVPMVGVGSAFDLLAGHTRPAPDWMKRNGLQWTFRLFQEPRRLLGRYAYYNTRFLWSCFQELSPHFGSSATRVVAPTPVTSKAAQGASTLSVVIVSYNVAELLAQCLTSVFRECSAIAVEVFVVDSASTDQTVEMVRARFPQVRLIPCADNVGFSAGNNLALRHCRGDFVVLLNPDTVVPPGSLLTLVRYLETHPSVGAVGPRLALENGETQPESARHAPRVSNLLPWLLLLDKAAWLLQGRGTRAPANSARHPPRGTLLDRFSLLSWRRDHSCAIDCICGACLMVRNEVLQEVGLLDESAPMYLDDIDYCRRIWRAGWEIHYVAEATITHLWRQSSGQLRREGDFYAMGCHSIWLYLRKHDGRIAASLFAVSAAFAGLVRLLLFSVLRFLPGRARKPAHRQWHLAFALTRWATRVPKAPPSLGFTVAAAGDVLDPSKVRLKA